MYLCVVIAACARRHTMKCDPGELCVESRLKSLEGLLCIILFIKANMAG